MKQDHQQLLKPELINSVSGLALIARVVVDGFLAGNHQSRKVGQGLEFSQYKAYQPGDDMRLLDWKMLARSGRYYIKQAEIDTQVAIKFVVDSSASMQYAESGLSKMDYARVLIASLAYLSYQQGDAVGLFALNDRALKSLYPTSNKQHYNRLLNELIRTTSTGSWPKNKRDIQKIHNRSHKELIFLVTDMYEYDDELSGWIQQLKTSKNEVVVIQLMGKNEMEFEYSGAMVFEDLETGHRVKIEANHAKAEYLNSLKEHLESIKEAMTTSGIGYELFRFDTPLHEVLQLFLKKRLRLH